MGIFHRKDSKTQPMRVLESGVRSDGSSSSGECNVYRHKDEPIFAVEDLTMGSESAKADFYRPIESYEGYHRYDPDFEWTAKEEKQIVRRLDLRICAYVCLMVSRGAAIQPIAS